MRSVKTLVLTAISYVKAAFLSCLLFYIDNFCIFAVIRYTYRYGKRKQLQRR